MFDIATGIYTYIEIQPKVAFAAVELFLGSKGVVSSLFDFRTRKPKQQNHIAKMIDSVTMEAIAQA
jgi:hypothetical protein